MNEFLEQFLIECRELTELATKDLLALEQSPRDGDRNAKDQIDSIFRAFHTLKGSAAIVEFPAMARALHAAEDVLSGVRAGDRAPSAELIGDCLSCLDQVDQWLDAIEAEGELPAAPDAAADALVAKFQQPGAPEAPVEATRDVPDWLEGFLGRHHERRHLARAVFRISPDHDCFFRGDDPLSLVMGLPGLLALELTPRRSWPPLDEFDPFECNLTISALTGDAPESIAATLRAAASSVEIWPLSPAGGPQGETLSPGAIAVLKEQALLAADGEADAFAGRLGSAGQVAANVLRQFGRIAMALAVQEAVDRSQRDGNAAAFIDALRTALELPDAPPVVSEVEEATAPPIDPTAGDATPRTMPVRALRVDVERIDALVKLTGELTVVKNAIGHAARLAQEGTGGQEGIGGLGEMLKDRHAQLDRLMGELQRSVMGIRVLPLSHVFQRFPRLIREMARDLGKTVQLVTEGDATEADKATVEALFEPLLHVLRNAVDHGIETEDERRAAGKPPTATVQISAVRDGEHVIVEVTDDGRGIDTAKVRKVAARRGIASEDVLAEMTDAAVVDLIFAPGFSTAATVTGISGRGVGMDAVRSAVARIGGEVVVVNRPALGTTVRFMLPFTLMISRVMTVEAGGQLFGVPVAGMVETVRLPRDRISRLGAAAAFVLRDRTIPLVRLADALDLPVMEDLPTLDANIVVIAMAGQLGAPQFCAIEVDAFGEQMDVMLKPMEGLLAGMNGFAGTTLLGDGRVLIVLDPRELLR